MSYVVQMEDANKVPIYPKTLADWVVRSGKSVRNNIPFLMVHTIDGGMHRLNTDRLPETGIVPVMFKSVGSFNNGADVIINSKFTAAIRTTGGEPISDTTIKTGSVVVAALDVDEHYLCVSGSDWASLSGRPLRFEPISHAHTSATYGPATVNFYGHAKSAGEDNMPKDCDGDASLGSEESVFARADHKHKNIPSKKLETPRKINGVSFDGTEDITISDNTKLPLAGGTMSGAIVLAANKQFGTGVSGMSAQNSDIVGVNAIWFSSDVSDARGEGILFLRSDSNYDQITAVDGNIMLYENSSRTSTGPLTGGGTVLVNRAEKRAGSFYAGAINPSSSGYRLNYDGDLYAFRVYNPVWADYAEFVRCDREYEPGTILCIDRSSEDHICKASEIEVSGDVLGIVSDEYGFCTGKKEIDEDLAIALCGRVHVKIIGGCRKGDYIVSGRGGVGKCVRDLSQAPRGTVLGRALESINTTEESKVLCFVQRM